MPYKSIFILADVLLDHNEAIIYHAYNQDDYEEPLHYWYSTASRCTNYASVCFDVRRLSKWNNADNVADYSREEDHIKKTIIAALESGELDDYIAAGKEMEGTG